MICLPKFVFEDMRVPKRYRPLQTTENSDNWRAVGFYYVCMKILLNENWELLVDQNPALVNKLLATSNKVPQENENYLVMVRKTVCLKSHAMHRTDWLTHLYIHTFSIGGLNQIFLRFLPPPSIFLVLEFFGAKHWCQHLPLINVLYL